MERWLSAAPPELLEAGAVRLRRLRPADAGPLTDLVNANLDHLRPWMPWAQSPMSRADHEAFLERMDRAWDQRTDFSYGLALSGGDLIGAAGLHSRQGPGTLEIGYWIAAVHAGHGHTTAAAGALAAAALALPGVTRVEIRCDEANRASARVPEKLGFRLVEARERPPEAPGERGRLLLWVLEKGA